MRKRFVERLEGMRGQTGFTLLELIATILILSILVAIAGNYYYHQRKKAWVAQVHASLHHMAGAENNFVYSLGANAYSNDLDDLYSSGYRWSTDSVIPYVALATNQTFCIQVHSAHDPTIVWHFSSEVGRQQEGPATPGDCGDPQVLGAYISGPPPASYGRDGQPSGLGGPGTAVASFDPGSDAGREGDGSSDGAGSFDSGGGLGTSDGDRSGTTDPGGSGGNSGSIIDSGSTGDSGAGGSGTGTADGTTGTCDGSTSGGSSGVSNHPSGKDRDTENGNSGSQGDSGSDPDGDENGGADKPGAGGGANTGDQDGNNGSGNDTDFEDDNRGPDRDGAGTPGTGCN